MSTATYRMTTVRGVTYVLDELGAVLSRTDGPRGWDYSGRWVILGAATRLNAHHVTSLASIADGGIPGQGWVHDRDHGTHRVWGGDRMKSLTRIAGVGA